MRKVLVLASVIVTGTTASCEHGPYSWCEGDWLVDLVKGCDYECDSLLKQKCSGTCVEGDFGAECVLTTRDECSPDAWYCKDSSMMHCGTSGHPDWEIDCVEEAQWVSGYGFHSGPSCVEGFGTAECVHEGLPCDPDRDYDCIDDYLIRCGSTGYALDYKACTTLTSLQHCVVQDGDAWCQ